MFQLSWGKLRREPATRWFDRSFAPIPTSDERFARQYRYELPPEFPLASPCAGIAHHLSGRIDCARPRTAHKRSSRAMLTPRTTRFGISAKKISAYTFIAHAKFQLRILAQALHSLVRVSRRVNELHVYTKSSDVPVKSPGIQGSCKQSHTYPPEAYIWNIQ